MAFWCSSKKHYWTNKSDADKCCSGEWTRILLIRTPQDPHVLEEADKLTRDSDAPSGYVGRKWIRLKK